MKTIFTLILLTTTSLTGQITIYQYKSKKIHHTWSACNKYHPGYHYNKIMYGKLTNAKTDYYVGFYCNGPIPKLRKEMGYAVYMLGITVSKYKNFKIQATPRWETGPTHIAAYYPKLDSIWRVKNKTYISLYMQFSGTVGYQYILQYKNHSFKMIKKWNGSAYIWSRHNHFNVAVKPMIGMLPAIYSLRRNYFIKTPIQKHAWYLIHRAQIAYRYMHHKPIAPDGLASLCEEAVRYANIAKDYSLGKDACHYARIKLLKGNNLIANGGEPGPAPRSEIINALKSISQQLKNVHKQHDFM